MNSIARLLLIVVCFFAAIACYFLGVPTGSVVFIVAGLIFESLFWLGVFGKKEKSPNAAIK